MEEDANLVTREQYREMLIDASFGEASEMESGFTSWCERHVPTWRKQGCTMLEIRDALRKTYADHPELYDLARERERIQPGLLRYRGNTGDLRQRYTLRVMIYETDKLAYEKFCRWSGLPVPSPDMIFLEQPDTVRVVRDLSTVEELEMMLAMSRYALHLFDAPENLTTDQIAPLMEAHGKHLRAIFIAKHGYRPEDSTTPYVPVTIDGPQDHDAYYAKEYP